MEIRIQSIRFDISSKLHDFIEKKVGKLEKFGDIESVDVQLKVVKPETAMNKETKLNVNVQGTTLFAERTCDTFEEGIDLTLDAIRVQLAKLKEKSRKN